MRLSSRCPLVGKSLGAVNEDPPSRSRSFQLFPEGITMTKAFTNTLACAIALGVSATAGAQKPDTATKTTKTSKAAAALRVLGFKPAAVPKTHNGKCPVTIKFQSWV